MNEEIKIEAEKQPEIPEDTKKKSDKKKIFFI